MPAKYIANVFPFRSIDSRYAGIKYRWICPGCNRAHYDYNVNEEAGVVYCVFCNETFEYIIKNSFKNGDVKGINLKGM